MRNLPMWAPLSIITVAVLLSPVLAFLTAIAVEILIGLLVEAGAPVLSALVATGAIAWPLSRKLRRRREATPIET
ncbi:MAG TPA: hypothetical protein VN849_01855 [Stellaceae bacterium]|nr:hypothetical protein [Stellaceae bacterium]